MYHAACKVEFQSFNRSYSRLTLFNFHKMGCKKKKKTRAVSGKNTDKITWPENGIDSSTTIQNYETTDQKTEALTPEI